MEGKESVLLRQEDRYVYDIDDPIKYGTDNNRLMKIERWRVDASFGQSASFAGPTASSANATSSGANATLSSGDPTLSNAGPTSPGGGPMASAGFAGPGGSGDTKRWTKYYYYSTNGNVLDDEGTIERIVKETEGIIQHTADRLGYGANARTVTHLLVKEWDASPGNFPTNYTVTSAHQYRYDRPRQRYLDRELDTAKVLFGPNTQFIGRFLP